MQCDVCHIGEAVGVCASPVSPMSQSICAKCLGHNAISAFEFSYMYDFAGLTEPNALSGYTTWFENSYMSWADWIKWRTEEPRKTKMDQARDKQIEDYIDAVAEVEEITYTEDNGVSDSISNTTTT